MKTFFSNWLLMSITFSVLLLLVVPVIINLFTRKQASPGLVGRASAKVNDFWFRAISPSRMRLFERLFAISFIYYIMGWMQHAEEWLTPSGFHFSDAVMGFHFPDPLPLMSADQIIWFKLLIFGAPTLVVLGLFRRVALALCFCCAVYIQLADINAAFTLNKLFIVFFMLLTLQPPAWRGPDGVLYQSAWPTRIIQTTLLVQYSTAGICKAVHGDWMWKHDILYGHSVGIYRTELASWIARNAPHWTWVAQTKFALAFELFAPLLFIKQISLRWLRRIPGLGRFKILERMNVRVIGFVLGIGMHIVIAALMKDLIYFSLQMITFYALFLPDSWCDWVQQRVPDITIRGIRRARGDSAKAAPADTKTVDAAA